MKTIKLVTEGIYLMGYNEKNEACCYYPLTKEAKKLDLPLLPPFEDKTYWIATVIFKDGTKLKSEKFYKYDSGIKSWSSKFSYLMGDKIESISYDKYTENQPKQFSLEDMKIHIDEFLEFCSKNYSYDATFGWYENGNPGRRPNTSTLIENYIQSLSTQLLPKEFILEEKSVEDIQKELGIYGHDEGLTESEYQEYLKTNSKYKTIINSEGK